MSDSSSDEDDMQKQLAEQQRRKKLKMKVWFRLVFVVYILKYDCNNDNWYQFRSFLSVPV